MGGPQNLANWHAARVPKRMRILEECISEVKRRSIQFKCISDLAKYLAEQVTLKEMGLDKEAQSSGISKTTRPCHYTALLRAPFRDQLDELIPLKQRNEPLDRARRDLHKAQTDLLILSNKCHEVEQRNIELQAELDMLRNASDYSIGQYSPDADAPYLMIKSLLRAFQDFYLIEGGRVVEATPLKKEIVSSKLTSYFLKWEEEHRYHYH